MPKFQMGELTSDLEYHESAMLGASAKQITDNDMAKPVKLIATDRYGLTADGDEIEGFVSSVSVETYDGYSFGSVKRGGRQFVELVGAASIGDLVVAAANTAAGVASTVNASRAVTGENALPKVKTGTPVNHKWRLISGTGVAGSIGLIERI